MFDSRWACLMYHSVPDAGDAADYFAVPHESFRSQTLQLSALGVTGVSVEAMLARAADTPTTARVAITFDDGRADNFSNALPALVSRGMSATFFVITGRVGTRGYASWDQLRAMRDAGMSIQSHTHTHPFLSELPSAAARGELERSRELLDRELGQETTTLALPNGDAPRGWTRGDYEAAGYRWVVTSDFGPNVGAPWRVRRYTIRRETTLADLERMVMTLPSALSREGIRLGVLRVARSALGVARYARWRRRVLRFAGR
jgi:peptidoglycan/xylan/chitin deacetylase (PgdA/CDA1 family)